jgi:hypothetical protein
MRYPREKEGNLGKVKPDLGELPLDHPFITKYSDPIHYAKNYKGELFMLVYLPKGKSETCKADALRLSRNLAYMLKQQIAKDDCTFEDFMKADEDTSFHQIILASASYHYHHNCCSRRTWKVSLGCIYIFFCSTFLCYLQHGSDLVSW